jgi:IclR family transcriptional regulator, pca regulon regulatory protein
MLSAELEVTNVPTHGIKERDRVAGVDKAIQVIAAFGADRGPKHRSGRLTLADVAAETSLSRAAARRYVLTLQHLGFVSQTGKLFSLTPRVLDLGQNYQRSIGRQSAYHSICSQLSHALREAATVSVLAGPQVICVAFYQADQLAPSWMRPGFSMPSHCTANGRLLLAALPDDELAEITKQIRYERYTPYTVATTEHFLAQIRHIRELGYALAEQEVELGLRTLAVPLKSASGATIAALSVSVSNNRMGMEEMRQRYLPAMQKLQILAAKDSFN